MTDFDDRETTRRLRSLERRLRRHRRDLERVNPIQEPGRYRALFEQVAAMEARRRWMRDGGT